MKEPERHEWFDYEADGKKVGRYGLSFYENTKQLGLGDVEIFPEYRNKGYGTMMIRDIILKYRPDYNLIYCFCHKDNVRALKFWYRIGAVSYWPNADGNYYVQLAIRHDDFDDGEENED